VLDLLWRCRYELALIGALAAAAILVPAPLSYVWLVAEIVTVAALLAVCLKAWLWSLAYNRRAMSATPPVHRRCARVRINPQHRELLLMLLAGHGPPGERGRLPCHAWPCFQDFEIGGDILGDVWADKVHLLQDPNDPASGSGT
jgi:hypothetical protein